MHGRLVRRCILGDSAPRATPLQTDHVQPSFTNVTQVGDDVMYDHSTLDPTTGRVETERTVIRNGQPRISHHFVRLPTGVFMSTSRGTDRSRRSSPLSSKPSSSRWSRRRAAGSPRSPARCVCTIRRPGTGSVRPVRPVRPTRPRPVRLRRVRRCASHGADRVAQHGVQRGRLRLDVRSRRPGGASRGLLAPVARPADGRGPGAARRRTLHLSFDVDGLDPSVTPGTGTPRLVSRI